MAAGTRHYVQQCWPGRTRPSKPRNAGKRPSRWSYDTTDLQRESGSATLDATRGSARRAAIDLANPYHVAGFMLWMRRKELRYYGGNPALAIAELARLDELSAAKAKTKRAAEDVNTANQEATAARLRADGAAAAAICQRA